MNADQTDSSERPLGPDPLSADARAERDVIIAEIVRAFDDVTREGGTSWSECEALDNWEDAAACELARRADRDSHWRELVDNPQWQPFPDIGGFAFANAIGFRYYLPPTMIRFLRGDVSHWYPDHLPSVIRGFAPFRPAPPWLDPGVDINKLSPSKHHELWSPAQLRCIARFMSFMSRHDPTGWADRASTETWANELKSGWQRHLSS